MEEKIQMTKPNDRNEDLSLEEEKNEDVKSFEEMFIEFEEMLIEGFEREELTLSWLLHGNKSGS